MNSTTTPKLVFMVTILWLQGLASDPLELDIQMESIVGMQNVPSESESARSRQALTGSKENMNGDYLISNPNPNSGNLGFNTRFFDRPDIEYFEVYSRPIKSRYADVYWTMQKPIPLDPALVSRFKGKTLAVVGYEGDQVFKGKNSREDQSVPITWAYNHHYVARLKSSNAKMKHLKNGAHPSGSENHGARTNWAFKLNVRATRSRNRPKSQDGIPIVQMFSEGNGGEWRKSYHGYPSGMAQLIDSPAHFLIEPMQIDTKNRNHNGTDFRAGIMPKASAAPPNASYSGLLECPCTTRINKNMHIEFNTRSEGICKTMVLNMTDCIHGAISVNKKFISAKRQEVHSKKFPYGCSIIDSTEPSTSSIILNLDRKGPQCEYGVKGKDLKWKGQSTNQTEGTRVKLAIELDKSTNTAKITITGPSEKWFGVGFGAKHMVDLPYATIYTASGIVERKLGNHDPGHILKQSVKLISNRTVDGFRTVVFTRPFKGLSDDHYTFDPVKTTAIPVIMASGKSLNFAYHGHKHRGGEYINLIASGAPTCVCNVGMAGTINYMDFPAPLFDKNCLKEPKGDLDQQDNPTVLLDKDQQQPEEVMEYYLKFRFYFQPYTPAGKATERPSHQNMIRLYWQTEAHAGEYDVPRADPGTPPHMTVHEITARWKVKEMLRECDLGHGNTKCTGNSTGYDGIHLIYAAGHCHAPDCISMELFNADTGKLLCRMDPVWGKSDKVYDERSYITLPPCLFGPKSEGLYPPDFLSFETNLLSVKRSNNTYTHYGEMASWKMLGVLVQKPVPTRKTIF